MVNCFSIYVAPTHHSVKACTAVVTEISYHDKSAIEADVSFLTMQEWKAELEVLLADLVDEDGSLKRTTDLKTDSGVAWSKVHAVYPRISQEELVKLSANEIIARDPRECFCCPLTIYLRSPKASLQS